MDLPLAQTNCDVGSAATGALTGFAFDGYHRVAAPAVAVAAVPRPNSGSIADYLASRASAEQYVDCQALLVLLQRVTGQIPCMWGPSIVGFGAYRYPLASGKFGESCGIGFAVRGKELVLYLFAEGVNQDGLLAKLGKYRFGKACLYFERLADLDVAILVAKG